MTNEIHFFDITFVTNDALSRCRNTAVHLNNELICEATLALLKEMIEGSLELFEDSGVLNQIGLHLWRDLLVELELLDNQIEIVKEGLLDVLSDIVVKGWLDVERLV